jgi:hypothetical protein
MSVDQSCVDSADVDMGEFDKPNVEMTCIFCRQKVQLSSNSKTEYSEHLGNDLVCVSIPTTDVFSFPVEVSIEY